MIKPRLLCITAHPDDEAGAFGGSLRLYGERGVETHVVCLTPGQAASNRGGHQGDAELAAVRRKEFAAACEILGVAHGEVLDYPDSRLDRVDLYAVVEELVERIRRIRPQVIITFGPEGALTAHTDHSMASVFATMAFHWAGRTNRYAEQLKNGLRPHRTQKLYYATARFTLPERQPVALPPQTARIDIAGYLQTKYQAFRAHQTQAPLFSILENRLGKAGNCELYHLAASALPEAIQTETDLFERVTID